MISETELLFLRQKVEQELCLYDNPHEYMWLDSDLDPVDDLTHLWENESVVDIRCGCSKAVLFCSYLDDALNGKSYVIKIPYLGWFNNHSFKFNFFKNATFTQDESPWDYCKAEANNYQKACKDGIGDLFCGTYYLLDINNYPVYISEQSASTLDENQREPSYEGIKYSFSRDIGKFNGITEDIVGLFYDSWGKDKTDRLLNFMRSNGIDDIHDGNVGYVDDKIRIIDYSTFLY